jgi:hypothetical protein
LRSLDWQNEPNLEGSETDEQISGEQEALGSEEESEEEI